MLQHMKTRIAWALIAALLLPMLCVPARAAEVSEPAETAAVTEDPGAAVQTDPVESTPGEPGEPVESTPGEPSEPVESTPSEPSEPVESEPTEPSEPEQSEPTEPTEPEETEPEEPVYQWERPEELGKVPQMFQTDYPDVAYGDGSVATSGCTMACIAMVASYLRGEEITPDELAIRFRKADGSHIQRMEAASTVLDLEYTKTNCFSDVVAALKQGKVAIVMFERQSDFTSTQHLVVCTNILPDGKILINDPNALNYRKSELEEGFTYGFAQSQLLRGFGCAWIYEFYREPVPGPSHYPDLNLTQEEKDTLAKLIWREARGEPFRGQQAVAEVVLNRVVSRAFPTNDVISTIYAEGQFNSAHLLNDTVADELQYKAIERALAGPNVLPDDVYYFSRNPQAEDLWGWIGGHAFHGLDW